MFLSLIVMLIFRTFLNINSLPDLPAYSSGFSQISQLPFSEVATSELFKVKMPEYGFRFLMKIVSIISGRFEIFLLVYGLIWILGYRIIIKQYSPYVIVSVLFLFSTVYIQSLFVLRQHLALLVVFLSYKYIIDKKPFSYLFLMLIAFSLHQSAIVALPLYFFYHIRSRRTLLMAFASTIVVSYYFYSVLMNYMASEVLVGVSSYLESTELTNFTGFILVLMHLLFFIYFLRKDIIKSGVNKVLFVSLVYGLIMSLFGIGYNPTGRLLMYMTNISFIEIPVVMSYVNKSWIRNMYMLLFLGISFYINFFGSQMSSIADFSF